MKLYSLCKPLFLLIAVTALAIFPGHQLHQRKGENMQKNSEFMKTLCVGRFLLEVPQKAIVSYRGARISGWEISSWVETDEEFLMRISNEEIKLRSQKNEKNAASLEQVVDVKTILFLVEYLYSIACGWNFLTSESRRELRQFQF